MRERETFEMCSRARETADTDITAVTTHTQTKLTLLPLHFLSFSCAARLLAAVREKE